MILYFFVLVYHLGMVILILEQEGKNAKDKDIWDESEVEVGNFDDRDLDPRPSPEYVSMFDDTVEAFLCSYLSLFPISS